MEISVCFKLVMLISELFPVIIIPIRPFFSCVSSINGYFCCSGLYQLGSSRCLLLWEPMDKASAQGKLSPVLSSPSYFSSFLMSLSFLILSFVHFFSSLSQWVHACDALQLPAQQREQLDSFIDQLYKDIEKGRVLSLLCSILQELIVASTE